MVLGKQAQRHVLCAHGVEMCNVTPFLLVSLFSALLHTSTETPNPASSEPASRVAAASQGGEIAFQNVPTTPPIKFRYWDSP